MQVDKQIYLAVLSSLPICVTQDNECRGSEKYHSFSRQTPHRRVSNGPYLLVWSQKKQIKQNGTQIRYSLFLCKWTLSSASNSVRQMQPHTFFNKFQIWRFFLNASAGHWKRRGGPHTALGPVVGPHCSMA